jgi:hypothetical protein
MVIDDDSDMGEHKHKLIQTSTDFGFTKLSALKCVEMMNPKALTNDFIDNFGKSAEALDEQIKSYHQGVLRQDGAKLSKWYTKYKEMSDKGFPI